MKTATDPRHKRRENQVKHLYTYSQSPEQIHPTIKTIVPHLKKIDHTIAASAPEWPVEQINKIDLAILRLATYELIFDPKVPHKVTIDEAVELGKTYGAKNTPSFVNGVLGSIVKKSKVRVKSEK